MMLTLLFTGHALLQEVIHKRKKSIHDFCLAYITADEFTFSTFIAKDKRKALVYYLRQNSKYISQLYNPSEEADNLEEILTDLFSSKKSEEEVYVIVFLEYVILRYCNAENLTITQITDHITVLLQEHSGFYPTRRYHRVLCKILHFFKLL